MAGKGSGADKKEVRRGHSLSRKGIGCADTVTGANEEDVGRKMPVWCPK